MQHVLPLIAAAAALAAPTIGTPETTGVGARSPVAVSTCAVTDLYDTAAMVEFGPRITFRSLALAFRNTDDAVATQVAFDVVHAGEHTTVLDRGRFSKGVLIEHNFDGDFADGYTREPDSCTVASITFADGRRWTAPSPRTTAWNSAR